MKIRIPTAALLATEQHASVIYALKEFLRNGPSDEEFGLCWNISQMVSKGHEHFIYDIGYEIVCKFLGVLTSYMSFPFAELPSTDNYDQRIRWVEIILAAYEGQRIVELDEEDVAALRDGYLHSCVIVEV